MATFKKFEEIECWKKARELTRRVYQLSAKANFGRDFGLRDQIRRASVSIMSSEVPESITRSASECGQVLNDAIELHRLQ